jgi:outer membrane biosynthesis protein TonB
MNRSQLRFNVTLALATFVATVLILLMRPQRNWRQQPETGQDQPTPQKQVPPPQDQVSTNQPAPQEPPVEQKPQPAQQTQPPAQVHVRVEEHPTPTPPSENMHSRVVADVRALSEKLLEYNTRNGVYPTTGQGLRALGNAPKDPWQHDYIFESPSTRNRESYDLFSAGPDGLPDTPDDDWGDESESGNSTEP